MASPSGRHFLQIPGPTNVPDRVLRAIDRPTIDHRGPEFAVLAKSVLSGMKRVFTDIRRDVDAARSRPALTELYKRAGYLITLTHAPSWQEKFGAKAASLRKVAEEEFAKTARKINRRAKAIGVAPPEGSVP